MLKGLLLKSTAMAAFQIMALSSRGSFGKSENSVSAVSDAADGYLSESDPWVVVAAMIVMQRVEC